MPITPSLSKTIQYVTINELIASSGDVGTGWYYTTDRGREGIWYYDNADTTSSNNSATVIVNADSKRFKRVLTNEYLDASVFGINYNTTASQSALLQQAISICAVNRVALKISGTIYLGTTVDVASDSYIFSENSGRLIYTYSGFGYSTLPQYCLKIVNRSNVVIKGIVSSTTRTDSNFCCFIYCSKSNNILIDGCKTTMSIVHMDSKAQVNMSDPYPVTNIITNNITVKNCKSNGYAQVLGTDSNGNNIVGRAGILIEYCKDILIHNNIIEKCSEGIQWWGGDSDPDKNGIIANKRKCENITITNNIVRDVQAGIWGSMGYNIIVNSNQVENCSDVGIDFEGCFNGIANGNIVKNCINGNLTTFFLNRNITFSNNTAISDGKHKDNIVRIYNDAVSTENDNVSFFNNIIEWQQTTNSVDSYINMYIEPCNLTTIKGNTFINVAITVLTDIGGDIVIEDNRFIYNGSLVIPEYFIKYSGAQDNRLFTVKKNSFRKSNVYATVGIYINSTKSNDMFLEDNIFSGFDKNQRCILIYDNHITTDPDNEQICYIKNNNFDKGYVERNSTIDSIAIIILSGNKTGLLRNYPSQLPTSGKWNEGQRIWLNVPVINLLGYVCISTGTYGSGTNPVWITIKNGS